MIIDVYSGILGGFSKGEIYKNQKWKFELCALLTDIFCTVVEHGDEAILNPYNISASKQVVIWPTGMLHTVSVQKMEAPRHKVLAIVDIANGPTSFTAVTSFTFIANYLCPFTMGIMGAPCLKLYGNTCSI